MQIRLEHLKLDKSQHNLKCTKDWCKEFGIDWGAFIRNGLPSTYLLEKAPNHVGLRALIERAEHHEAAKSTRP
jgi:hypothetical protein